MDPHVTIKELANTLSIETETVDGILKSQLELSKVCAKWVPHSLTAAQKVHRLNCLKTLLQMYAGRDHRRLFEIVTGDETWGDTIPLFLRNQTRFGRKVNQTRL